MRKTYGIFKGKAISEIPSWHLKWLAENAKDDKLATAADKEWAFRELHNAHID